MTVPSAARSVAPALERVRGGQVPVAALGGLVEVEAVVDAERHLVERLGELQVGRSGVDRVRAEDDEHLDRARLHLADEGFEGRRLADRGRLGGSGVGDGRARPLPSASFIAWAIAWTAGGCDSPAITRAFAPARFRSFTIGPTQAWATPPSTATPTPAATARAKPSISELRSGEAVVGGGAGGRGRALDHVQPVHLRPLAARLAARGELAQEAQARRVARDEVGLEAEDHVGPLEAVLRLDRLAEGQDGPRPAVVAAGGLPAHPLRLRESSEDAGHLRGEGRRGHAAGQEAQARAPLRLLLVERLAERGVEVAPGSVLADVEDRLRSVGVVEAEHVGLPEDVRRRRGSPGGRGCPRPSWAGPRGSPRGRRARSRRGPRRWRRRAAARARAARAAARRAGSSPPAASCRR